MQIKKILALAALFLPLLAGAQRLPGNVVPDHYDLKFTPDLQAAAFAGEEVIDVRVLKSGTSVKLNAAELALQSATITQGSTTQEVQVALDDANEQATLTVPAPLSAGPAQIRIKFTGILNDKLRGFYLSKTRLRRYATTQFESTDARRAFPSFDEPAFKATFDITLVVDQGDTAISNGRIVSDTPDSAANKHVLKFSTTPKMSTYLVAMAVGDFTCNEGSADGIPVRVCGTPDRKPMGVAALRYAEEILKYYNQYYGIRYPFGKLDILGLPDFEAGAMENTAAIFYRESLLFLDDKTAAVDSRQAVFEVLAHEMAHQWFGDLVTMKWWDNIWLNEGFATWMALKPSQALHPEWNAALSAVQETNDALRTDALKSTHPIRARAETPEEINEMFDSISYQKGAAVLRMIESYVSPDVFRRGVNVYLHNFEYGNATAEDFWGTIAKVSQRPVDQIMPTFVEQAGEPLISVKAACANIAPEKVASKGKRRSSKSLTPQSKTEVTISQQRFFSDPAEVAGSSELWKIPVCVKAAGNKPFCQILTQREQTIPLTGCSPWVFTNVNGVGYYRTHYDTDILGKLSGSAIAELSPAERAFLLSDEASLVRAGKDNIGNFLDLVAAMNQDQEKTVLESYSGSLQTIAGYLVRDQDRDAFRQWIRSNFRPMMQKVGWNPTPGEKDDTRLLRGDLISILGELGEDPETIQQATKVARQYLQNFDAVDPSVARASLNIAAHHGNALLFDEFIQVLRQTQSPEPFYNITNALSNFYDPQIVERWMEMIVSPSFRNQDAPHMIAAMVNDPETHRVAWEWVKAHWPDVEKKITMSSGSSIIAATRSFCDVESRNDVQAFFSTHKVPASERALKQSGEAIDSCIRYREEQQPNLSAWLGKHNGGAVSGTR